MEEWRHSLRNMERAMSSFRGWFMWYTLEFVITLALDIYILWRYGRELSGLMLVFLVFGIGLFFTVAPYVRAVRTCKELEALSSAPIPGEASASLRSVVKIAREAILMSSYYPVVALILLLLARDFSHKGQ